LSKTSFLIFGKYGITIVSYFGGGVRGGNMGVELGWKVME
jgi:hypothetical protein